MACALIQRSPSTADHGIGESHFPDRLADQMPRSSIKLMNMMGNNAMGHRIRSGLMGSALLMMGLGGIASGAMSTDSTITRTAHTPIESAIASTPATIDDYTRAMEIGYAATAQGDYHTALINFRRALESRPGDRYALDAIANVESYIQQQRAAAARQQEITALQVRLTQAVAAKDWACAATTVDRLITLVPPNSSDRAKLVAYRGQLTGFLEARTNLDAWSTVCPG